jgi:hypothetical protein
MAGVIARGLTCVGVAALQCRGLARAGVVGALLREPVPPFPAFAAPLCPPLRSHPPSPPLPPCPALDSRSPQRRRPQGPRHRGARGHRPPPPRGRRGRGGHRVSAARPRVRRTITRPAALAGSGCARRSAAGLIPQCGSGTRTPSRLRAALPPAAARKGAVSAWAPRSGAARCLRARQRRWGGREKEDTNSEGGAARAPFCIHPTRSPTHTYTSMVRRGAGCCGGAGRARSSRAAVAPPPGIAAASLQVRARRATSGRRPVKRPDIELEMCAA